MKRLLFLSILIVLAQISAFAEFTVNGINYGIMSDNSGVYVAENDYISGLVSIPEDVTYNGQSYKVVKIGDAAFYKCHSLTSVTIPNSVTNIGNFAFFGCISLASVAIPNSVTNIGDFAFFSCNSLTSVAIPNSVTNIGDYAFSGCANLASINIPNSITNIGRAAIPIIATITQKPHEDWKWSIFRKYYHDVNDHFSFQ